MKRMKRVFIFTVFLMVLGILSSGIASALSTNLKPEYSPMETIILKIDGSILESIEKVRFTKAGHVQEVPIEYEIKRLGENYFVWAISPRAEGNYSLILDDVSTIVNGNPKKINFQQNFSVRGNTTQYSIKPGFASSDKDFSIKVNLYDDKEREIEIDFPTKRKFILKPGENIIDFSMNDVNYIKLVEINIGNYKMPAYLIGDILIVQNDSKLKFLPSEIKKEIPASENNIVLRFSIVNQWEKEIKNIEIYYPESLFSLNPKGKINLKSGESAEYNLTLKNNNNITIREIVYARTGEINAPLSIKIDFIDKKIEDSKTDSKKSEIKLYRCSELGGKICKGEEVCKGVKNTSLEGQCCIGSCTVEKEDGFLSRMIGYLLAIAVVVGLAYFYLRYKKTKAGENIIQKKIRENEEKIP